MVSLFYLLVVASWLYWSSRRVKSDRLEAMKKLRSSESELCRPPDNFEHLSVNGHLITRNRPIFQLLRITRILVLRQLKHLRPEGTLQANPPANPSANVKVPILANVAGAFLVIC